MRRRNENQDIGGRGQGGWRSSRFDTGRGGRGMDSERSFGRDRSFDESWGSRDRDTYGGGWGRSDFGRQEQFRYQDRDEDMGTTHFDRYDRVNRGGRNERLGRPEMADYSGFNDRQEFGRQERGGFFGKGPKGWRRNSERLKEDVCEALWRNPRVDASEIEVTIEDNNCVCLKGTVDSREAKREAESAIENLSGVEDVRNELRVNPEMNNRGPQSSQGRETTLRGSTGGQAANLS